MLHGAGFAAAGGALQYRCCLLYTSFSIHLRPRIFRKLQHHIAKVTGLTQADLDKGEPIVQGLRRFMPVSYTHLPFIAVGKDGPHHLDIALSRPQFEMMTGDLLSRTVTPVQNALRRCV